MRKPAGFSAAVFLFIKIDRIFVKGARGLWAGSKGQGDCWQPDSIPGTRMVSDVPLQVSFNLLCVLSPYT